VKKKNQCFFSEKPPRPSKKTHARLSSEARNSA
jgi:hypothetical protein